MKPLAASRSLSAVNRPAPSPPFGRPASARFSAEEFLRTARLGAFDETRVELEHGEIIRMNPPHAPHGAAVARVIVALASAVGRSEIRVTGETAVVLADDTAFALDAALVQGEVPQGACAPEQLLLAVEVADTSLERDLGAKALEYARAQIPACWVVDVSAGAIHVMTAPGEDGYLSRTVVRFAETLALPGGLGEVVLG